MAASVKNALVQLETGIGIVVVLIVALVGLVLFLPIAPFLFVWARIRDARLRKEFVEVWGGKFVVFVYSNSPHWKDRIENEVLPLIQEHAVVLNWSERSSERWTSKPVEVRVFERWAGDREFNPAAIVLEPGQKVRVVRFWQAYRDFKHGKAALLQKRESELFRLLAIPESRWPSERAYVYA